MKVIIVSEDPKEFYPPIIKGGHALLSETNALEFLVQSIVKFSPHLVVLDGRIVSRGSIDELGPRFPSVRFVYLPDQSGPQRRYRLQEALKKGILSPHCPEDFPTPRHLIFANQFYPHQAQKGSGTESSTSEQTEAIQELRLFWILQTARRNRDAANRYWKTVRILEPWESQEQGYRLLSGSFMASAFARQQTARHLGFLAHFVPGVDISCLPPPAELNSPFTYVHYEPPVEMVYAAMVLSLFGYSANLCGPITEALLWRHSEEDHSKAIDSGLKLMGLCHSLRAVAAAQSRTVEWLLDPQTVGILEQRPSRMLQRARETFAEFWDLDEIFCRSQNLGILLTQFHESSVELPVPTPLLPPTFQQFVNSLPEKQWSEKKTRNQHRR